jgi:flagellar hook-associated protein 1 FlgK
MSGGLLNVGVRALTANQTVLQTTGNNIANVNTPGYSRQMVSLQNTAGQNFGGGYIGKGVEVVAIKRAYDDFLTRQATLAGSVSAGDTLRANKLTQLEGLFPGGDSGLGAAVSNMLNAFSDVASAPTDITARNVALTRINETAQRMSGISSSMDDMQQNLTQELNAKLNSVNKLAQGIAAVNEKIVNAQGTGQQPNDLLDQRDQLVRELNQYVQTTSIAGADGGVNIFIGGSQPLVLGTSVATLGLSNDSFGDPHSAKLTLTSGGQTIMMDENILGGGEVSSLLRFQNTDMAQARNLLGRYTIAISTSMNDQHKLGLDLDGNPGANLFTPTDLNTANNVLAPKAPAVLNSAGAGTLTLAVSDTTRLVASDYEIDFSSPTAGVAVRRSDGVSTAFQFTPGTVVPTVTAGSFKFFNTLTGAYDLPALDGLQLGAPSSSAPMAGDRFLIQPYSTSASNIKAEFSTPRALAVASPWVAAMSTTNLGSLQLIGLKTQTNPYPAANTTPVTPLTLKFTGPNQYIRSDDPLYANYPDPTATLPQPVAYTYSSGQPIEASLPNNYPTVPYTYASLSGWSLTLQGSPKTGDSITVKTQPAAYRNLDSGNANAMMNLRDTPMFDGATLTDGYAGLIADVGIRAQSANYTASVSSSLATNLEKDRTAVAGVNLDEEAAKLLQYQQAYQASAKMIQISQSIFDTLIQTVAR